MPREGLGWRPDVHDEVALLAKYVFSEATRGVSELRTCGCLLPVRNAGVRHHQLWLPAGRSYVVHHGGAESPEASGFRPRRRPLGRERNLELSQVSRLTSTVGNRTTPPAVTTDTTMNKTVS